MTARRSTTIRPIRTDETEALSGLTLDAYADLRVDIGPYRATLGDVAVRARRADVLVALDRGRLLGGVTYVSDHHNPYAEFADTDAAGIRMLAVAPDAQHRGVGAALVDACIARAAAAGRRRIVLHTTSAMDVARRLYERRGFVRASDRDWSPQPGIRLLGYELAMMHDPTPTRGRTVVR